MLGAALAFAVLSPVSLFNGRDLAGWSMDVPDLDSNPSGIKPFQARSGMLVSLGRPGGHLITEQAYANYRLAIEYRFAKGAGNCGVLVHASTPRFIGILPKGLEIQMKVGNAGDFVHLGEQIALPGQPAPAPQSQPQIRMMGRRSGWAERPAGEWNRFLIECRGRAVSVWLNGVLVNEGVHCTAESGKIALQSEGAEVEFRRVEISPLK